MSDLLNKLTTETRLNMILCDSVAASTEMLDEGFFDREAKLAKLMANKAIDIVCEQHSVAVSLEVRAAMQKLWVVAIIAHHEVARAVYEGEDFNLIDLSEVLNATIN